MRSIISLILLSFLFFTQISAQNRNCATMEVLEQQIKENPSLKKNMEEIERHTREFIRKNPNGTGTRNIITIPVVFHVLYNTATENISDAQLQSQLDVLNADFRALNSDVSQTPSLFEPVVADAQIEFCLATRTPSGSATTGITRKYTTNTSWGTSNALKNTSQGGTSPWNPNQYLNIWVCNIGNGILGYATLPGGSPALDGVVLDYRYTGTIGTATVPYHKGRTGTHEVGHWLNLNHIWGDATCGNDLVADTPVHDSPNFQCFPFPHYSTCAGTPIEMTMNYMDYTPDACMYMFTNGQKARMRAVLQGGPRASLLTSPGCLPVDPNSCNVPAPFNVNAANATSSSFTSDWGAVPNATSYTFEYKLSTATTWIAQTVNVTSIEITGLSPSSTYNTRVRANCSAGSSDYTNIVNVTTASPLPCTAPTGLATSNISHNGATVSWNSVVPATSYDLEFKVSSASTWTVINTTNTSVNLTNLNSSTTYNLRVRSNCTSTVSSYSSTVNFTTTAPPGSCTDTYETNNTISQAKSIPLNTIVRAKIGVSTDVDWFKFNNTKNQRNIRVTLSNLPANYNIRLYRGSTLVASSSNSGTSNEVIIFNTTTKETTYNIEIFGVSGAFNDLCYDLFVEISGTPYRLEAKGDNQDVIAATDEMTLVPNPANDFITVILPYDDTESTGDLTLIDITGKTVYNQSVRVNEQIHKFTVDVSNMNNGIYMVRYSSDSGIITKKLMISR